MIFKGIKFRKNKNYVNMPDSWLKENGYETNFLRFGKIADKDVEGAVETKWFYMDWEKEKTPIFAVPVQCEGHSRTNMMYGKVANREMIFLMVDGMIFTAPVKPRTIRY